MLVVPGSAAWSSEGTLTLDFSAQGLPACDFGGLLKWVFVVMVVWEREPSQAGTLAAQQVLG
jgi:hypothetical protein